MDDFLAPLVLEIDVDIRRFVALLGDKTLEQEIVRLGIDAGDPEDVTDRRIRRRSPALAKNALAAGETDDAVDRQEIWRVVHLLDEVELVSH
ncbi:hypothetical protein D3C80_1610170 [compost metagenome]